MRCVGCGLWLRRKMPMVEVPRCTPRVARGLLIMGLAAMLLCWLPLYFKKASDFRHASM